MKKALRKWGGEGAERNAFFVVVFHSFGDEKRTGEGRGDFLYTHPMTSDSPSHGTCYLRERKKVEKVQQTKLVTQNPAQNS